LFKEKLYKEEKEYSLKKTLKIFITIVRVKNFSSSQDLAVPSHRYTKPLLGNLIGLAKDFVLRMVVMRLPGAIS